MKTIKSIKFYQGIVVGGGATHTSFQPDDGLSDQTQRKGLKAEVHDKGVYLTSATGECLVPWNNVAYIQYLSETESSPVSSKSKSK